MSIRRLLLPTVLLLAAAASGCSQDHVRSRVWVDEINLNAGLNSDVYNNGADRQPGTADDYIIEDAVTVTFFNDPKTSSNIEIAGPYSLIYIESYRVDFESNERIEGVTGKLGWVVEAYGEFTGSLTIVPANRKTTAPLIGLQQGGEITASAKVTFYARESDSDNKFQFETYLPVHFANWSD